MYHRLDRFIYMKKNRKIKHFGSHLWKMWICSSTYNSMATGHAPSTEENCVISSKAPGQLLMDLVGRLFCHSRKRRMASNNGYIFFFSIIWKWTLDVEVTLSNADHNIYFQSGRCSSLDLSPQQNPVLFRKHNVFLSLSVRGGQYLHFNE